MMLMRGALRQTDWTNIARADASPLARSLESASEHISSAGPHS